MSYSCCYKTNIDPTIVFDRSWKYTTTYSTLYEIRKNIVPLDDKWLKKMKAIGLTVEHTLAFYRVNPTKESFYQQLTAHIDIHSRTLQPAMNPALNIIIGGKDSYMQWYKTPDEDFNFLYTPAKTAYVQWAVNDLELIEKTHLDESVSFLVRTDIPHSILIGEEPRLCISIRFKPISTSWERTVDFFFSKDLIYNPILL